MIVRPYRFTLDLQVLDGPFKGATIDLQFEGSVIDTLDEIFDGIRLPTWLAIATSATSH